MYVYKKNCWGGHAVHDKNMLSCAHSAHIQGWWRPSLFFK